MSINFEVTMQDMKFIMAALRAAGAQKEWTEETKRTKKATDDNERSLDRMAKAVERMHATPLEKYNREMEKLDELLKRGKISQDLHARAVAAAKNQYDAATKSAEQLQFRGYDSLMDIAGSLGMVTTAGAAAAKAVQAIGDAFKFAEEQGKRAADEMDKLFALRRTLNQVAEGPEHLREMIQTADVAAAKYGVSREKAHEIMADVVGLGIEQEFETIMQAEAGALSAADAGRMVKKVLAIYRAKDPELTARAAIDMSLEAARESELSFEDLASGIAQASEGGAVVGASAEETISTLSVLGGKFASVQTAADRIKGFSARAGANERLKGRGIIGAFRALRDEFSVEERKKFLGDSQELNIMYTMLMEEEEAILKRQEEVSRARELSESGEGAVAQALRRAEVTPELQGPIQKQRSQIALRIAEETRLGAYTQRQESAVTDVQRRQLESGHWFGTRWAGSMAATQAKWLGLPGELIPFAAAAQLSLTGMGVPGSMGGNASQDLIAATLKEAASDLREAAREQQEAARRRPPIHSAAQIEAAATIH